MVCMVLGTNLVASLVPDRAVTVTALIALVIVRVG